MKYSREGHGLDWHTRSSLEFESMANDCELKNSQPYLYFLGVNIEFLALFVGSIFPSYLKLEVCVVKESTLQQLKWETSQI